MLSLAAPTAFVRRALADCAGVAATEFALATPIVMLLLLGGFDVGRFALATQRVEVVANEVAEMLAQTAPNTASIGSGDGTVNDIQLGNYRDAAMFIFPQALTAASQQGVALSSILKVDMSSVKFTVTPAGCASGCTYTPKVVWSTGLRPCNTTFTPVANTSTPSATALPTDVYSPNSLIVVDVVYVFSPTFGASFLPSSTIKRSVYMTPRNVSIVETSGSALAPNCPGVL